jgi:hypothetical protein
MEGEKIIPPGQKTSTEHPFTNPKFIAVVQKYAPEYTDKLAEAEKPTISEHPDELEAWEAEQIEKRKQQLPYESDFSYAIRVLYEETFSVNQFPEKSFKGSNGLTVGGLISHFYTINIINGVKASDAQNWELNGST